jgi:hypothetical protein
VAFSEPKPGFVVRYDYLRKSNRGSPPLASHNDPLQPQVFDLLSFRSANRDRVVTKDDLIAAVGEDVSSRGRR